MLDDLGGDDAADRFTGQRGDIAERVALRHLEPVFARDSHHGIVGIHAPRAHAGRPQRRQELPASAAEVDDVGRAGEDRQVVNELRRHAFVRAAERVFEANVLVVVI